MSLENKPKKKRKSIAKQEDLVSALYDFAHNQQTKSHNNKHTSLDGKVTTINTDSVGEAMREIMAIFGYEVTPIY